MSKTLNGIHTNNKTNAENMFSYSKTSANRQTHAPLKKRSL